MSPFTRSWLCLASFPILLQSHWPAFPRLWAGVHRVPAATCSLLGILPPPTPGGFSASERRQGLASGKGVSSRPEWVFLGSRGKPQGCRCFNPFTSGVLSSHQSLCALVHRALCAPYREKTTFWLRWSYLWVLGGVPAELKVSDMPEQFVRNRG